MQLPQIIIFQDNLDNITSDIIPSIIQRLQHIGYNSLCLEYPLSDKQILLNRLRTESTTLNIAIVDPVIETLKIKNINPNILQDLNHVGLRNLLRDLGFAKEGLWLMASSIIVFYNMQKIISTIQKLGMNVQGIDIPTDIETLINPDNLQARSIHMLTQLKILEKKEQHCALVLGKIHTNNFINLLASQNLLKHYLILDLSSKSTLYNNAESLNAYPYQVQKIIVTKNNFHFALQQIETAIRARIQQMTPGTPGAINWQYRQTQSLPIGNYVILENMRQLLKPN